jgi:hypothetical protein
LFPAESPYSSFIASDKLLLLICLFQNPYKTPTFSFATGSALGNLNNVANAGLVTLIMNRQLRSAPYVFAVFRMPDFEINGNFDALITAIAYHYAGCSF